MPSQPSVRPWVINEITQGNEPGTYVTLPRRLSENAGSPTGREPQGDGASLVVGRRESRLHGEGRQVSRGSRAARDAKCRVPRWFWVSSTSAANEDCRWRESTDNCSTKELYLLAYGKIYRNQGAMTPGATQETVDGMNRARGRAIIAALQDERYRFPARPTPLHREEKLDQEASPGHPYLVR